MSIYQYRVIPAPTKGLKAKGIKGPEARFFQRCRRPDEPDG